MSIKRTIRQDDFFEDDVIEALDNDGPGVSEVFAEIAHASTLIGQLEIKEIFACDLLKFLGFPTDPPAIRRTLREKSRRIERNGIISEDTRRVAPIIHDALRVIERCRLIREHMARWSKDGKYSEDAMLEGIRLGDDYRRLRTRATLTQKRKRKDPAYSQVDIETIRKLWAGVRGKQSDTRRAELVSEKAAKGGMSISYKSVLHYCADLRK